MSTVPWRRGCGGGDGVFEDRNEAGRKLSKAVAETVDAPNADAQVWVLALARGGVPVAAHVAAQLHAPLDVTIARKLGVPGQPEWAFGAIAPGGVALFDDEIIGAAHVTDAQQHAAVERETQEMQRRLERYRDGRPEPDLKGAVVVLVDDGVATGSTMRAAVASVRQRHPAWLVVAVPAGPRDTIEQLRGEVDALVCLERPSPFYAVGQAYRSFPQVTDEEVQRTLASAWGAGG